MPTFNLTNAALDNLRASIGLAASLPLPTKASFALLKNSNEIQRHLKEYDAKAGELLQEYAERDEDGKVKSTPREDGRVSFRLNPERIAEYAAERETLDGLIVENVTLHFAPESAFDSLKDAIQPKDLALIAWMIDGLSTLESAAALPERAPDPSP